MNSKNVTIFVIIVLAIGGYFWLLSPDKKDTTVKTDEKSVAEQQRDNTILALADKYQANKEIPSNIAYSYQLEEALVKADKPIIFTAELDDIFRKDGKLFVRFAPAPFDYSEPQIFYTLSGCDEKLLQIDGRKRDLWGEYIVVAKISDVSKPIVKIEASPIDEEDAEIEVSRPETFMASGACLDFEYMKDGSADELFNDNG